MIPLDKFSFYHRMMFINMNVNSHSYYNTEGMMEQIVTINGAEIFVKDVGQGVPLLMLHGSPDTAEMWEPLMERLKDKVRCIAIDLPGFGRSTMPANFSMSVDNFADFV